MIKCEKTYFAFSIYCRGIEFALFENIGFVYRSWKSIGLR